ncbi:MAG TPA: hypothetical protein VEK79_15150 [Thermoanaerobaculia bacterium]|nr:hypothetical protein [Thermoanaerobaculia bacterium]
MTIDYQHFRGMGWSDRLAIFNALPATEKAALVQTHISRWLDAHRAELAPAQIEILEANIRVVRAELYEDTVPDELLRAAKQLESRTAALLSREQMREALTMHW